MLGDGGGPGRSLYGDIKPAGNTVVQVAAGWYRHHLILRSDGTVWAGAGTAPASWATAPRPARACRFR